MKYLKQFGIIAGITVVGEILKWVVPLPIPASIYGLVIMLVLLITRIIPLSAVEDASDFLINIMPVMFVPAGVGIMSTWLQLKNMLVALIVIIPVTTFIVMVVTAKITDLVIHSKEGKKDE